jgi:hypothetical protein
MIPVAIVVFRVGAFLTGTLRGIPRSLFMRRYLPLVVLVGCVANLEIDATPAASRILGISDVNISETRDRTVITAVDADNQTVATLDLVHGPFVPTEDYGPKFRGREVDGRKLFVEVKGQVITWETMGFTDTSHMPALPPDLNLVAAFLADRRVRPVLEKWRIGWAAGPAPVARTPAATPLNDVIAFGTNPVDCSGYGLSCPIRGGLTQACNGFQVDQAFVITREGIPDEDVVSACCVLPSIGDAFVVKACAPPGSVVTSCGVTGPGIRCRACPGYPRPYSTSCSLSARYAGFENAAGEPVFFIHHCDAAPGTPPAITVGPSIEIWPPDRKMRAFTLADFVSAMDACDNAIDVNARGTITSITSNEPESDDFAITGTSSFAVRADRNGSGNGRVYEIHFSVADVSGTSASGLVFVRVPHDPK